MRTVGLDLAGSEKNDSGFCIFDVGERKTVSCRLLHSDEQIIEEIKAASADIVAIDSPLTFGGSQRSCDSQLSMYGVLPVTLAGMATLAKRGVALAAKLNAEGLRTVEVSTRASSKILGVYHKVDFDMQKAIMGLDLDGDVNMRILTRDELDAICCAFVGYLHLVGGSKEVGDAEGVIIVPDV